MTIFPTWYPDKWSADNTDKIWASDEVTNFNITVNDIGDRTFADKSTDNLAEWTNEYYTEAKVTANTTVVALWDDKADKTNVLELDNTTSYTPTESYHPATKEYVDNTPIPDATTTQKWIVLIATDTEAKEWTNETKLINSKQVNDINYTNEVVASDTLQLSADTEREISTGWSFQIFKQITLWYFSENWTVRVTFDAEFGSNEYGTLRFRKDWVIVDSFTSTDDVYKSFSYDVSIWKNTVLDIQAESNGTPWELIKNFRVKYDLVKQEKDWVININ